MGPHAGVRMRVFELEGNRAGPGSFSVFMLEQHDGYSIDDLRRLRCDLVVQFGAGRSVWNPTRVDGVAVIVLAGMTHDEAHEVSDALGGENGPPAPACPDRPRVRLAG